MTSTRIDDTQAIRQILADQYEAWAAGDAERFVADYDAEATVITPGIYRRNRDEVRDGMAANFGGVFAKSTVTDEIQDIRFLGPDHAVVVSRAGILFAGETELPADRYVNATWVLVKQDDRWSVAAYHNSPVVSN
ncbi:SgcJ/EcaC family oxidoreductase [Nocardia stercoris]|uniref:SgcJ/EcaC family oxidoreductase n=1 Tax=Nocardia stercoris TaxID=2483361 RepID=A0A3M2L700_9NOCA|nr:SgcJ/EcaC family oxidoreductase [Nocardia stercoris]RMI33411.1 SgcJ/EcaC family oxidoreductase [Nocardia stercoris]